MVGSRVVVAVMGVVLLPLSSGWGASRVWDGGGADSAWSTASNWDGDATAPVANDSLTFSGTLGLMSNNNLAADTMFAGITFSGAGTGSFVLTGNRVTLTGNINDNNTTPQSINLPIVLANLTTVTVVPGGSLTFGGVLSGSSLRCTGGGEVTYSAHNTSTTTDVEWSTLHLGATNAIPTSGGNLWLFGTSDPTQLSTFDLHGFNQTLSGLNAQYEFNVVGTPANLFIENDAPGTLSVLSLNLSSVALIHASIRDNKGTGGTLKLIKNGTAELDLFAQNSYTGGTEISQGTVNIQHDNALPSGGPLTLDGGNLTMIPSSQSPGVLSLLANASLFIFSNPGSAILHFADSSQQTWSGTLTIFNWQGDSNGGGIDHLYFGNNANGLTPEQLTHIVFSGATVPGAHILATGEVVPNSLIGPEPSSAAMLIASVLLLVRPRRTPAWSDSALRGPAMP